MTNPPVPARCTGHCCRRFALPHSIEELRALARSGASTESASSSDIRTVAEMLIPIRSSKDAKEHLYRCKNLRPNGDCGIYEIRPQMCRDFPAPRGCHFWSCTSSESAYHGMGILKKLRTRWSWLRRLNQKNTQS